MLCLSVRLRLRRNAILLNKYTYNTQLRNNRRKCLRIRRFSEVFLIFLFLTLI